MRYLSLITLLVFSLLIGCSPKQSEIILAQYDDEIITMNDFEKAYSKNVGGFENAAEDSIKNYQDFFDLYLNFRLKIHDAKKRGFEKDPALSNELLDYQKKIGASFVLERNLINPKLEALYEKRKHELRISHLMIKTDSLGEVGAYSLTDSLIQRIKKGESFENLVKEYSADGFTKNSGGDIYYFTGGQIIPTFEEAAYKIQNIGEIYPTPVKTRFGYHILKLTDKKLRKPQIRASHILIDFKNEEGVIDSSYSLERVNEVFNKIESGENFAELAKEYSEDPGSKEKGGDLGFFERRQMVREFDEAAFKLNVGEVSPIVKTGYGYHIILLTDEKKIQSFDEDKSSIRDIYQKVYFQDDKKLLMDSLKQKFNLVFNKDIVDSISNFVEVKKDTVRFGTNFFGSSIQQKYGDSTLFVLNNFKVSVDSFFTRIKEDARYLGRIITKSYMEQSLSSITDEMLLEEESLVLDKQDPTFAELMKDYKNGIYIFKLQEDEVWKKIDLDSLKLLEFYNERKSNYVWGDRAEFSEIFSTRDSLIKNYYNELKNGTHFDSLAAKYTERPGYKQKLGRFPMLDISTDELAAKAYTLDEGKFSEPFKSKNGYSLVFLHKKDPSRIKSFDEARAEVASQYQDSESKRLEKEYIERLRKQYSPEININELSKAFKKE